VSDFSQRIRDARLEFAPSRPRSGGGAAPPPVEALRAPAGAAEDRTSLEVLEAQRRRVELLARKVDELNAAIVSELLQHPDALGGYSRAVAGLAPSSASAERVRPA